MNQPRRAEDLSDEIVISEKIVYAPQLHFAELRRIKVRVHVDDRRRGHNLLDCPAKTAGIRHQARV
jgi:hypothetical protein